MADKIPVAPGFGGGGGSGSGSSSSGSGSSYGGGSSSSSSYGGGGSSGGGGGGGGGGRRRGGKKGGKGKGGGGGSPEQKAARRYAEQAETLGLQAKALRKALSKQGFQRSLRRKLANVERVARQVDRSFMDSYLDRIEGLERAAEDNEQAVAQQSFANLTNRGRERANAVSEAMLQGAGESDLLRAQEMSLRQWDANQDEVNRAFHDTLTSVNSSLTDLTVDTRSARIQNQVQKNADKDLLWTTYFDQRSEALTNLGNTYGQMAEYYASAKELAPKGRAPGGGGKKGGKGKKGGGDRRPFQAGGGGREGVKANTRPIRPGVAATPRGGNANASQSFLGGRGRTQGRGLEFEPGKGGKGGKKGKGKKGNGPRSRRYGALLNYYQDESGDAFMKAAQTAGNAWRNPGVPRRLMRWEGREDFEGRLNNGNINDAAGVGQQRRPEGATLRKWET